VPSRHGNPKSSGNGRHRAPPHRGLVSHAAEPRWRKAGTSIAPRWSRRLGNITARAPSPHDEILINTAPKGGAIRAGNWKLVINGGATVHDDEDEQPSDDAADPKTELFNLAEDPSESKNLAASNPDKVKDLRARYDSYAFKQSRRSRGQRSRDSRCRRFGAVRLISSPDRSQGPTLPMGQQSSTAETPRRFPIGCVDRQVYSAVPSVR
jgi:hypothetical protein